MRHPANRISKQQPSFSTSSPPRFPRPENYSHHFTSRRRRHSPTTMARHQTNDHTWHLAASPPEPLLPTAPAYTGRCPCCGADEHGRFRWGWSTTSKGVAAGVKEHARGRMGRLDRAGTQAGPSTNFTVVGDDGPRRAGPSMNIAIGGEDGTH